MSISTIIRQQSIDFYLTFYREKGYIALQRFILPMRYNVAQLLKEPIGATRSYRLPDEKAAGSEFDADFISGAVQFLRTHQGVLARGAVEAQVTQTCGRCLREFTGLSRLLVEEEFFPQVDVNTGRRLALPADVDGTAIDANHILDLTEVLRQSLVAAQPMKPLCRPDCSGLCPECGADRNAESCPCGLAVRDPRWDALTALLRESES